ncbi:putative metal-dependent hydrolase [Actinomadura rubteroloni]|uniref:Putative metal-dependent hydrolase n=1 Tax=Actinomadura rubteroloni TaxID=1926885 RepID=A0A2P4UII9_9ACTN|nr:metal-dependent hydrolase [Actinomadura rubteroloni]POM24831.1 putative metal-dependent hydrolase [Actinomadura rubteroloni]
MGVPTVNDTAVDERHPPMKVRRVTFDWSRTPVHWIPDAPAATHMVNFFQILLTTGEKWFVQCVQEATPYLDDPRLRAEIKDFIGQEIVHARNHQGVLDQLLAENGLPTDHITGPAHAQLTERAKKMAELARRSPRRFRRRLLFELGAVSAIEHYTAVVGEWIIKNTVLDECGADPVMLDLFRWHGAEEVEHRSVVFDVFEQLGGKYPLRAVSWVIAVTLLSSTLAAGTLDLLRRDPAIKGPVTLPRVYRSYRRSVRRGQIPGMAMFFLKEGLIYLRPSHHPSKVCSTQLAVDYLKRSPAAQAAGYTPY